MKQSEILFLLGSAVVVVFVWIAFTILHNSLTSTISGETIQAIVPIQPTFDTKVIDVMKKRTVVEPLNTIQPPTQTAIVVTTAPTAAPTLIAPAPTAAVATTGGALQ